MGLGAHGRGGQLPLAMRDIHEPGESGHRGPGSRSRARIPRSASGRQRYRATRRGRQHQGDAEEALAEVATLGALRGTAEHSCRAAELACNAAELSCNAAEPSSRATALSCNAAEGSGHAPRPPANAAEIVGSATPIHCNDPAFTGDATPIDCNAPAFGGNATTTAGNATRSRATLPKFQAALP